MIKSYGKIALTREQGLARANAALADRGHAYKLGAGARNPNHPNPYSTKEYGGRTCVDCSGFVCYCIGIDKFLGYSGGVISEAHELWVYTDTIQADAVIRSGFFPPRGAPRLFRLVTKEEAVLPGDIVVYDSHYPPGAERIPGHTGLIVEVGASFVRGRTVYKKGKHDAYGNRVVDTGHPDNWFNNLLIAHATPSHRSRYGNVVAETTAYAWRPRTYAGAVDGGYIVRYLGWTDDLGAK